MSMWDQRYAQDGFAYGANPNDFLKACLHHIPKEDVLCIADGEGRNSVFLAQNGCRVQSVDLSSVGLAKANQLAKDKDVSITTELADMAEYDMGQSKWDAIISIFAHMPPAIRTKVHAGAVRALKPGGVFILEAYTPRQLELGGIGGPNAQTMELFMSLPALLNELNGLSFLLAHDIDHEVNEGKYHQGMAATVQIIAKKKG